MLENEIFENIRAFILKFGKEFLFIKNQYGSNTNFKHRYIS